MKKLRILLWVYPRLLSELVAQQIAARPGLELAGSYSEPDEPLAEALGEVAADVIVITSPRPVELEEIDSLWDVGGFDGWVVISTHGGMELIMANDETGRRASAERIAIKLGNLTPAELADAIERYVHR